MLVSSINDDTLLIYGTASESEFKAFASGVMSLVSKVYP
jgi:hypothetical protein